MILPLSKVVVLMILDLLHDGAQAYLLQSAA
jgi:hypothetical protein